VTSAVAISVDRLGKRYRLGRHRAPYATLRETLGRAFRPGARGETTAERELWALRDVSFDVAAGEIVGVIGRNGAGKSTLLKILSRITRPTTGRGVIVGRLGALLEVGTGFHRELTGRENIFLNGAVLGMRRADIARQLEAIAAFAEVEAFLDTPVKHYSSGMYLRLAFAVAAHLEPEVLLVDEVLAVGDVAFQRKCLGKMSEVAGSGRTVLFVSHSMTAIAALCSRCLLLADGRVEDDGPPEKVIRRYMNSAERSMSIPLRDRTDRVGDGRARLTALRLLDAALNPVYRAESGSEVVIDLDYEARAGTSLAALAFEIGVYNQLGQLVFLCGSDFAGQLPPTLPREGSVRCRIPGLPLPHGRYHLNVFCGARGDAADWITSAAIVDVGEGDFFGTGRLPPGLGGTVMVAHRWELVDSH
jgi:lipopolysaccharide transport system ATP-binding protein